VGDAESGPQEGLVDGGGGTGKEGRVGVDLLDLGKGARIARLAVELRRVGRVARLASVHLRGVCLFAGGSGMKGTGFGLHNTLGAISHWSLQDSSRYLTEKPRR